MNKTKDFLVRPATFEDAPRIGLVQTLSWKTTYKGIVHQSFLDSLEVEPRVESAKKRFHNPQLFDFVLVDLKTQNVVGFAVIGPCREKNVDADSELYAIYILHEYQGQGGGKLLFEAGLQTIRELNYKKMMVSVLNDNLSSRTFYEKMGGQYIGQDHVDLDNQRYVTATYLWIF
jgi:L-amino acid N-acyltransferase YncA